MLLFIVDHLWESSPVGVGSVAYLVFPVLLRISGALQNVREKKREQCVTRSFADFLAVRVSIQYDSSSPVSKPKQKICGHPHSNKKRYRVEKGL